MIISLEVYQCLILENETSNCLYIIREGEVDCYSKDTLIRTLKQGDYFGEKSILLGENRSKDVIAKTDCVCYSISTNILAHMIGKNYREILYVNFMKIAISESEYFKRFNLKMLDNVLSLFQVKYFNQNEIVLYEGHDMSSSFIILIQGRLRNAYTKEIVAEKGQILFEKALMTSNHMK